MTDTTALALRVLKLQKEFTEHAANEQWAHGPEGFDAPRSHEEIAADYAVALRELLQAPAEEGSEVLP
jgi:hypothetical protein